MDLLAFSTKAFLEFEKLPLIYLSTWHGLAPHGITDIFLQNLIRYVAFVNTYTTHNPLICFDEGNSE